MFQIGFRIFLLHIILFLIALSSCLLFVREDTFLSVLNVFDLKVVEDLNGKFCPELREVVACSEFLRRKISLFRRETGGAEEPITHNDHAHAEEFAHEQVLEGLLPQLVALGLKTTVLSSHSVCKMGYMISFQPIRESTLLNHIILAVDNLRAVVIEDNYTIEYIAFYLGCPHANTSFDLLVQVYIFLLDNFHV